MGVADAQHFFILGAAKCGTTSLYRYVDQHPDTFLSTPKEPIFFEAQYERGLDFYHGTYFGAWKGERAVGEARAHHLFLPFVAPRIYESFPDARIIAVLRNPAERAFSEWWHRYSRGLETLSFPDALEANLRRIESGQTFEGADGERAWREGLRDKRRTATRYGLYLELGYYAVQIERYLSLFRASQLKILFFEDLSRCSASVTREVWEFIGVDQTHTLDNSSVHNVALQEVRIPLAAWLRRLPRPALLRRLLPAPIRERWSRMLTGRTADRPAMDAATERWLIEHYTPFNRALERLVGRELPGWFEPKAGRSIEVPADDD